MNICFSKAVVDALFCCEHGSASWRVYPSKLATKHILPFVYIVIVIVCDSIMFGSRNVGCC